MSYTIGIDLGNYGTRAAVYEGGQLDSIPMNGAESIPSAFAFDFDGSITTDPVLTRQLMETSPQRTASGFRRGLVDKTMYRPVNREFDAATGLSAILSRVRTDAEDYLGESVRDAVIAIPSHFSQNRRRDVIEAAKRAKLDQVRLISESDALFMLAGKDDDDTRTIMACDLGHSAFSVTTGHAGNGVYEVLSTAGDVRLGCMDFDEIMARSIAERFRRENGVDLLGDPVAAARLRHAAGQARVFLAEHEAANVFLPYVAVTKDGPLHLNTVVTREMLAAETKPLTDRIAALTRQALQDYMGLGDSKGKLDALVLNGGGMFIPGVRRIIEDIAQSASVQLCSGEGQVAAGAAMLGAMLNGRLTNQLLLAVTPMDIGIETFGGVFTPLVSRNTTIPIKQTQTFSTAEDNQVNVEGKIYEGLSDRVSENEFLFSFNHKIKHPGPKGVPQIEVSFNIWPDGMLKVECRETPGQTDTGRKEQEQQPQTQATAEPAEPPGGLIDEARFATLKEAVEAVLPTIDNLELAIDATRKVPGGEAFARGMQMTLDGLIGNLAKLGVEEIPALNRPFNPRLHNAVSRAPDGPPGIVVAVEKRGYRLCGRIIRYASVKVGGR